MSAASRTRRPAMLDDMPVEEWMTDDAANRLLAALYPTRIERVLERLMLGLDDTGEALMWVGGRLGFIIDWLRRRRIRRGDYIGKGRWF